MTWDSWSLCYNCIPITWTKVLNFILQIPWVWALLLHICILKQCIWKVLYQCTLQQFFFSSTFCFSPPHSKWYVYTSWSFSFTAIYFSVFRSSHLFILSVTDRHLALVPFFLLLQPDNFVNLSQCTHVRVSLAYVIGESTVGKAQNLGSSLPGLDSSSASYQLHDW